MTSTVRSLAPEHAIIEGTHEGEVTSSDLKRSGHEALELGRANGITHLLTDCTGMTGAPGNIELLALMDLVDDEARPAFRQALVWPTDADARLALDFWRTVEVNHHHLAKAFGDREAAIAWLDSQA